MPRPSSLFLSLSIVAAAFLGSCGDDGGGPEVSLSDSGPAPADAAVDAGAPDAFVCTMTDCGGACVDTTTDVNHCGGCDMACASAGQVCSGSLPCACPESFVPATVGGTFDQISMQAGAYLAIAPLGLTSPLNVVIVAYELTLDLDTEYDLAESLAATTPPSIILGNDVDISSMNAKAAYAATEGTISFDRVCADGASGTVTDVVFAEVGGIADPTPVEGGCSYAYDTIAFDIGTCPDPNP